MLSFAALTPHSPLLLSSINKDRLKDVEKTRRGMEILKEELYAARPETILLISSHATMYPDTFSFNLHDEYSVDFSEFGDLATRKTFLPDVGFMDQWQRSLRRQGIPVTLSSDAVLDYGAGVPLALLTERLPNVRLAPLAFCDLSVKEHFTCGEALKDVLLNNPKRVAVVASGDQSHTLTSQSPGGFHPSGKIYDEKIQECLANGNSAGLLQMDPEIVKNAKECGFRPLLMLLGLLDRQSFRPAILSYEAPFGVGFLTVNFELS